MKKLLMLPIMVFVFGLLKAQTGTIVTDNLKSEILKREMGYSVYLPPSYNHSVRNYPVMYLLHGMTGDHTDWVVKGETSHIASQAMSSGKVPEMIIVMPDGLFDAFYINNYDKSILWEDFFHKEFIPAVEKKYRIIAKKQTRAIAGLSMGGYGSTYHALKYKDKFSSCYAMSAAYIEIDPLKPGEQPPAGGFENVYVKLWGARDKSGLHENYKKHSIIEMVKAMDEYNPPMGWGTGLALPRITIDCGDDDFLLKQNTNLVHMMKEKKIPFEFRVREGGHTWQYWRESLDLALTYVSESFRN
jgi:S-formylglutathione hydrolase FrmB